MSCLIAFHYRSYGTFFLHKIGSIISIGDLPTTNIIEPLFHIFNYRSLNETLKLYIVHLGFLQTFITLPRAAASA